MYSLSIKPNIDGEFFTILLFGVRFVWKYFTFKKIPSAQNTFLYIFIEFFYRMPEYKDTIFLIRRSAHLLSIPSSLDDNMVVEEGNNYRADANVLIVVTNYSKFENKTTPA